MSRGGGRHCRAEKGTAAGSGGEGKPTAVRTGRNQRVLLCSSPASEVWFCEHRANCGSRVVGHLHDSSGRSGSLVAKTVHGWSTRTFRLNECA